MTDEKVKTDFVYTGEPMASISLHNNMSPFGYSMSFKTEDGKEACISVTDGKVTYSGDIPIDESAQLFFKLVLMQWRNFGQDEDYRNAKLEALEAGYPENKRLAEVIRDLYDLSDVKKTVLETIRYEAKQESSERMQRILKYAERALGLVP